MSKKLKSKNPADNSVEYGVYDLLESLVETQDKVNEKLGNLRVAEFVCVTFDDSKNEMIVSINGNETFAMKVSDEKAREAYNPLCAAIWRAAQPYMSAAKKADSSESAEQEAPVDVEDVRESKTYSSKPRRDKQGPRGKIDTSRSFRDSVLRFVNDVNVRCAKENVDKLFTYKIENGHCTVNAGDEFVVDAWLSGDVDVAMSEATSMIGALCKIKTVGWHRFDILKNEQWAKEGKRGTFVKKERREPAAQKHEPSEKREQPAGQNQQVVQEPPKKSLKELVTDVANEASSKLSELQINALTVVDDDIGIFVYSGKLPVASAPVNAEDVDKNLKAISEKIWSFVNYSKVAYERRQQNEVRMKDLEFNSEYDKAMAKRFGFNPNVPVAEAKAEEPVAEAKVEEPVAEAEVEEPVAEAKVEEPVAEAKAEEPVAEAKVEEKDWLFAPNPEVAKDIVSAVKKATRTHTRNLRMRFFALWSRLGKDLVSFEVKGFSRGVVVLCGGEPSYITMFPIVGNNATAKDAIAHIETEVKSVCEERIKRLEEMRAEFERVEKFASLSARKADLKAKGEELEKDIQAMAM